MLPLRCGSISTTWLWTALTAEGLPMVCLNARHAKKALDMKVNKTDANDAEGDHDAVDYPELCQTASLIVDTRNACQRAGYVGHNVIKA